MKIPYKAKYKISSLTIYSSNHFSASELEFLKALDYTIQHFEGIEKDNYSLCINLTHNRFLIANHDSQYTTNPLAFVDEKGNIQFSVDISIFQNKIQEFQNYVSYDGSQNQRKNWSHEQKVSQAIKEYKNDTLDFCINNVVSNRILENARIIYDSLEHDEL